MRVLFDATAVPADRGGVGRYVDNVIPALVRRGVEVVVACQISDVAHYSALSATAAIGAPQAATRIPVRLGWEQVGLPRAARRCGADVVHSPHYTMPLRSFRRSVVTLHDATFFTEPALHTRVKGPFFRAATRIALRGARQCVVPSEATARELVRVAGANPRRLTVAHLGVDRKVFRPPAPAQRAHLRQVLGLAADEPYIAFLGTLEPRKNVPALIEAWAQLSQPPTLVLAGHTGWDPQVEQAIRLQPPQRRVLRPGYLPLELLAALLADAEVVVYPSLGEGFGLPVLEAMACGAAVLTTPRLALPEIGGDAVAYTEPSAPAIAEALRRLLNDADERTRLAAAGLRRAARFTWDACAEAHQLAYAEAMR